MSEHRQKADGRRVFSSSFKGTAVQRILTAEKTLAELSRELDISPSVIRNWKRFVEAGATTAVQASEDFVPTSSCGRRTPRSELERALGRKTMEVEILARLRRYLVRITPPAYSPESNGLAEAFVGTFKRDYVSGAEFRDAETVLAQLSGWIDDYNTQAPRSALGMRSPTLTLSPSP